MARKVVIDRTLEPLFASVVGHNFQTKVDLVLYQHGDSREITVNHFGAPDVPKNEEIQSRFPYNHFGATILGVLPAGSILQVTRVTQEGTTSLSFVYYFDFIGKEIHVTSLTNVLEKPPVFENKYVKEIEVKHQK